MEWPTPVPTVTFIPEKDGTDVISAVVVELRVDGYPEIADYVRRGMDDRIGEETCCKCDNTIRYVQEPGKTVATCPECGAVNPLCGICGRDGDCANCSLEKKCEELNALLAAPAPKSDDWGEGWDA